MTAVPDWLDDYLIRLDWSGPALDGATAGRDNARAILDALIAYHAATIPFENIDPMLDRPVDITPGAVIDKLVRRGRGGYCFEQNTLFQQVLEALGYRVETLLARSMWINHDPTIQPRTHMALKVDLDENAAPLIVDVGFGGNVLTASLELRDGVEQATPHGPFRLVERDDGWLQMVRIGNDWRWSYLFSLAPQYPVDFAVPNWWIATHPASPFRQELVATLAPVGRRLALRGRHLSIYPNDGPKEEQMLPSGAAVAEALETQFGIALDDRAALIARIDSAEEIA